MLRGKNSTYRELFLKGLVWFKFDFDFRLGASGVVFSWIGDSRGGFGDFVFFERRLDGRRFITFPPRTELETDSASEKSRPRERWNFNYNRNYSSEAYVY